MNTAEGRWLRSMMETSSLRIGIRKASTYWIPATKPVTPFMDANPKVYYANFNVYPAKANWVLAIREDHSSQDVEITLVAIDAACKTIHTIARGADFYAHPQFNPASDKLCWTQWNHPNMPWSGTEL